MIKVLINRDTGDIKVYSYLTVVDDDKPDDYPDEVEYDSEGNEIEIELFNPETEIKLSDARREDKSLNVGDTIDTEVTPKDFGQCSSINCITSSSSKNEGSRKK